MRSRYRILKRDQSHFITATTVGWLPIFTTAVCVPKCNFGTRELLADSVAEAFV